MASFLIIVVAGYSHFEDEMVLMMTSKVFANWIGWGALVMLLLVVGGLGWFVWPTPYRYTSMMGLPFRINRITGQKEFFAFRHGWIAEERVDQLLAQGTLDKDQRSSTSLEDLDQLRVALLLYAQDHDGQLPTLTDSEALKAALFPYVGTDVVFLDPQTGEPYQPNPALSNRNLESIRQPANTVVLYEPRTAIDGTRGVAFLDGQAKRIPEKDWLQLKRESMID